MITNAKRAELLPTDAAIRFYRLPDGHDAMYTVAEERDQLHARAWRAALDQGAKPADIVRGELDACPLENAPAHQKSLKAQA
jgi:hypothetical protein